jgi:hypothetical protein
MTHCWDYKGLPYRYQKVVAVASVFNAAIQGLRISFGGTSDQHGHLFMLQSDLRTDAAPDEPTCRAPETELPQRQRTWCESIHHVSIFTPGRHGVTRYEAFLQ